MNVKDRFGTTDPLIGMVHLPALPGAPEFAGDRGAIHGRAMSDAYALVEAGFDGLLVENYGDRPYHAGDVPRHTVAEMTAIAQELGIGVEAPVGVNVLRNDAPAAVSIAAATGAAFVRVNVHTGSRVTDQGTVDGRAGETLRLRERLDADVAILADVAVKHSVPVADRDSPTVVRETVERGLADGLVVTGPATGDPVDVDHLRTVLDARDDVDPSVPVFVGSGVTRDNGTSLLEMADGAIVGTALKRRGVTGNPVGPDRAAAFVEAVRNE